MLYVINKNDWRLFFHHSICVTQRTTPKQSHSNFFSQIHLETNSQMKRDAHFPRSKPKIAYHLRICDNILSETYKCVVCVFQTYIFDLCSFGQIKSTIWKERCISHFWTLVIYVRLVINDHANGHYDWIFCNLANYIVICILWGRLCYFITFLLLRKCKDKFNLKWIFNIL